MKCMGCDGGTMTTRREDHQYDESGLRGITLIGMEVSRCDSCSHVEVAIPNLEGLHQAIARMLILRPERLLPAEIRFLRKHLGFTGRDLAAHLGVTPETVSRWENGALRMDVPVERLLRMVVARKEPVRDYERELPQVAVKAARRRKVRLRSRKGDWSRAA